MRMMKGFHEMKKSHQALLRYLNMDLATAMETFMGFIAEESGGKVTVPYRQSLDYILIRLQGLAKLLIRVVECSKNSAKFFLGLIKAGSFYMKGAIFLSTLAAVWNRSREFCKFVVEQYDKLIEFRMKLEEKPGTKWIDGQYELPETLEIWIGEDYTKLITNETYDIRLLLKENDIQDFLDNKDDFSDVLRRIKVEDDNCADRDVSMEDVKSEETLPNELEIEDFTPIARTVKKAVVLEDSLEHSILSLSSKDSVIKFIKNETHYRKVDPKKSLSITKMKKKDWKEFTNDIKNKSLLMQEGAFVNFVKDYLEEFKI